MDMHIYIRKELEQRFKAETNKSELVNKLLKWYYQKQDKDIAKAQPQTTPPEPTA